MNGRFIISGHAVDQFAARFNDPEATALDLARMLAEAYVVSTVKNGGEIYCRAILEDACFVLRRISYDEHEVITTLRRPENSRAEWWTRKPTNRRTTWAGRRLDNEWGQS